MAGTLMVEPTESETLAELDRFFDAMIAIRDEIAQGRERRLAARRQPAEERAAHRRRAAERRLAARLHPRAGGLPVPALRAAKYWPPVGRVDNVYGDRNLFCSCVPLSDYGQPLSSGCTGRAQRVRGSELGVAAVDDELFAGGCRPPHRWPGTPRCRRNRRPRAQRRAGMRGNTASANFGLLTARSVMSVTIQPGRIDVHADVVPRQLDRQRTSHRP